MHPVVRQFAPYALALLLVGGWRVSDIRRQRAIGAARAEVSYLRDSLRAREREGRKIDSVFRVDTVRLTRRIETTRTLIDTLLHSDTVTLTRRESVLVFVADSLVQQCRATVGSCTARVANLTEQLSLTIAQRDAYRVLIPSGFQTATRSLRDVAIGAALHWLISRRD